MLRRFVPIGMLAVTLAGSAVPVARAEESASRDRAPVLDSAAFGRAIIGTGPLDRAALESAELDELERALGSKARITRMLAVKNLGARAGFGRSSPRVLALLGVAAGDADPNVALQARAELARLQGVDPIPDAVRREYRLAQAEVERKEIERNLGSPDALTRLRGVERLVSLREGSAGEAWVRALLGRVRHDADLDVAHQASVELARLDGVDLIGPEVREAHRLSLERREVDGLEAELVSEAMVERLGAVQRLADLERGALEPERVVSLLRAATRDPNLDVAEQARIVLAKRDERRGE